MRLALALDIGTTSLGAIAIDAGGRVRGSVQRPNTAHRRGLPAGHAEQDPDAILDAAYAVLRELAGKIVGEPAAIGLTGQMHGILFADRANHPLTPLISWQDRRATETAGGRTLLEEFLARCPDSALENAGCRPAPGYGGVTLFALGVRGALPRGDWRTMTIADWVGARLAGAPPRIDASHAAALGLFDAVAGRWSEALLDAAGVAESRLPEPIESGGAVGGLSPEAAATTGLAAGTPLIAAIGDNQAAVLGSLPGGENALQINIGTGGQVNLPIPRFLRADGLDTRPLPVGRFMLTGAGVSGGDAYAWVERTVSRWLEAFGANCDADAIYERLAELAAALPDDAGGLVSRPVFRGTRRWPDERGSFQGVTFDNFTPGHVARAVLDGIAAGLRELIAAAPPDAAPEPERIIATGNAVRRNPLLARALELRFGLPVWIPEHREEAAYGAALLAGVAAGLWRSLNEAGKVMRLRPALADEPASGPF